MSDPFPKGPPCYSMICPSILHVEAIVIAIGRRIGRCIEHKVPLSYKIACGDVDTGALLRLLLKGRGLDPKGSAREDFPDKFRRDSGTGPIIYGTIPVDFLPVALYTMGPRAKPGAVAVHAQSPTAAAHANGTDK